MEKNNLTDMIDDLILIESISDGELKHALQYWENEAQSRGITFYDMIYQVLLDHEMNQRAKKWINKGQII